MTYNRIFRLIETHKRASAQELHNIGAAVALAFHDPKGLKEILKPKPTVDMEQLPGPLRIPKKVNNG